MLVCIIINMEELLFKILVCIINNLKVVDWFYLNIRGVWLKWVFYMLYYFFILYYGNGFNLKIFYEFLKSWLLRFISCLFFLLVWINFILIILFKFGIVNDWLFDWLIIYFVFIRNKNNIVIYVFGFIFLMWINKDVKNFNFYLVWLDIVKLVFFLIC